MRAEIKASSLLPTKQAQCVDLREASTCALLVPLWYTSVLTLYAAEGPGLSCAHAAHWQHSEPCNASLCLTMTAQMHS